jgi:uncharacterized protein YgbK (DUF1537 family)
MYRILIIADDLSGAADCGMAFAVSRLSTMVVLGDGTGAVDADVLSVDGDTRGLDPQQAAHKTEWLMRKYGASGDQIIFKKLDSTLRGNVGAELASVLRVRRNVIPRAVAVLAPAFPANGRTTVGGQQFLNGKPLEEMEICQREGRRSCSHIPGIIGDAGMRSALVSLKTVRSTNDELRKAMRKLAEETDVLVCDAESDQDLHAIAGASATLGSGTVWAGSAGLAYHLPQTTGLIGTPFAFPKEPLATGPTLFVIGSPANTSREQARVLSDSLGITTVTVPAEDLAAGTAAREMQERQLADALGSGHDVVVSLGKEKIGASDARLPCFTLAEMLAPHADSVGALVATGGETARAVLKAWGVSALRLVQELEAGVPFCITENWRRRLPVLTKAGDFGSPQTLLHCRDFVSALDRTSSQRKEL